MPTIRGLRAPRRLEEPLFTDDRCDCRCRAVNRCFVSGPLKREYFAYLLPRV